jgi:demethoxyubiquinone hydroxylase (CLK1/Coq7/Cat5 family)
MPATSHRSAAVPRGGIPTTAQAFVTQVQDQVQTLAESFIASLEQAQRQLTEAIDELRARMQEGADQAQERAGAAAGLALKLAYAYVGAVTVAQEEITARVRRTRV